MRVLSLELRAVNESDFLWHWSEHTKLFPNILGGILQGTIDLPHIRLEGIKIALFRMDGELPVPLIDVVRMCIVEISLVGPYSIHIHQNPLVTCFEAENFQLLPLPTRESSWNFTHAPICHDKIHGLKFRGCVIQSGASPDNQGGRNLGEIQLLQQPGLKHMFETPQGLLSLKLVVSSCTSGRSRDWFQPSMLGTLLRGCVRYCGS
mmetsp:Transcript_654/g.787  ORF Transcript_654/g.787 Transcript_654/m.787 type:complete len:206 (-) Transcript_654:187-804(-)